MLSDTRQEFPIATATTVTTTTPTTDFDSTRPLAQQQPQQHSSSLSTKRREKKCQRKHRCSNGNGRWSLFATTLLYWALFALVALCCSSGGANARHILLQQQPQYLRAYQRGAAEVREGRWSYIFSLTSTLLKWIEWTLSEFRDGRCHVKSQRSDLKNLMIKAKSLFCLACRRCVGLALQRHPISSTTPSKCRSARTPSWSTAWLAWTWAD